MPQLTPEQLTQLDTNIKSMLENGGTQADVENYAKDFRERYDVKKKNGQLQNGSSVLEPQSEQELLPFKSPTNQIPEGAIVNNFGTEYEYKKGEWYEKGSTSPIRYQAHDAPIFEKQWLNENKFKSPTQILSESGGGGSFFPEGVENGVGAALPAKREIIEAQKNVFGIPLYEHPATKGTPIGNFSGGVEQLVSNEARLKLKAQQNPIFAAVDRGVLTGEIADIINTGRVPTKEELSRVAELNRQQQNLPQSDTYKKFSQAETTKEALETLVSSPTAFVDVASQIMLESLSAQLRHGVTRMAAGAVEGAAAGSLFLGIGAAPGAGIGILAGMGVASLNLEYSGKILQSLQEAGIDITNAQSLQEGFANKELMSKASEIALKKAVPIALFDLFSGGIAGKILSRPIKTVVGKVGAYGAETAIQSGLGMGGELTGQLVAGEDISGKDILAEGIGEIGGGAPEIIAGTIVHKKVNGEPTTTETIDLIQQLPKENKQQVAEEMIDVSVGTGQLTSQQAEEIKTEVAEVIRVDEKIPEEILPIKRSEIIPLIQEKETAEVVIKNLQTEKQNLDVNFHPLQDEKIETENKKIKKANNEIKSITEQKKTLYDSEKFIGKDTEQDLSWDINVDTLSDGSRVIEAKRVGSEDKQVIKVSKDFKGTNEEAINAHFGGLDKIEKSITEQKKQDTRTEEPTIERLGSDEKVLQQLHDTVIDYKENPSVGDLKKVAKIKKYLTETLEGQRSVEITQEYLRNKYGDEVPVFRGGERDFGNSDAGWTTDYQRAVDFAARSNGEVKMGTIRPEDILYSDELIDAQLGKKGFNENEIITNTVNDVKGKGYIDVGKFEEGLPENKRYTNLGYSSSELIEHAAQKIKSAGLEVPKDIADKAGGGGFDEFAQNYTPKDFRNYLNEVSSGRADKGGFQDERVTKSPQKYGNRKRAYGDYLYLEDRFMFDELYNRFKKSEQPKELNIGEYGNLRQLYEAQKTKAGGDKGVGAVLQEGEPRDLIGATVVAKKELTGVGGKKKQFEGQVKIVGEEKDSQGNTLFDGRYTDAKGNERSILLRGEDIKTSDLGVKKEGEGAALPEGGAKKVSDLKVGDKITLNDGSEWTLKKVFDNSKIKDKLYQGLQKTFGQGNKDYTLHNPKTGSDVLFSEKQLSDALKPKETRLQKSTQLTQPKTKLQLAKEKFENSFKQAQENRKKTDTNLGAIKDPLKEAKKQAELDRQTFDDLVDYAREGINEEFKTLKAFIERIPDEAKRIAQIAWKVANNVIKYEDAVREVERLSEGRDIPPIEPPKEGIIEGESPKEVSGIKKALVSDEIIEGVNLDKIGDKEMMDLGRKILDTKEVNPEAIVRNIVSTGKGVLTPKEVVALITHKADLDTALREAYRKKNEIIESGEQRGEDLGVINAEISALEGKIHDFDVMAVITANQQSMAFRLRKMMLDKDYNVVTQIEKYKANNDGYIPPEVEARFRELGKELDVVKGKLAKAEEVVRLREEQDAAASITEDVGRKKKRGEISEEEVVQKVKEGIEGEINDIHSKLSPERKRLADKAIAVLERLQEKIRKNTYSDATGMLAIVDAGITTIKRAIKAGVAVADAIELGIKKIKDGLAKQGIKDWAKENDFRKDMIDGFEAEKISTTKPKKDTPEIKEDGTIKIPNGMIRGLVERGITEIGELTDAVHAEVIKELPGATKRQVRDAITDYGRTVNPTADVIQSQVNAAKRTGMLLSELEDLQAGKSKAKGKQLFKLTEREKDLKRQINALTKNAGLTPEQISLKEQKARAKNRIAELEKRLREKDFSKKPKPIKSTDTEIVELNKEKERLQEEFDKEQYENELKNRSGWQKAEDVALELVSGLPRALVASIDFSAIFIQGLRRLATSPIQSAKALKESFRQFASEKRQNDWMNNLKAQEFYPLLEASKLAITKTEGKISKREELFISNWVNLIYNGLGKLITLGHEPSYNVWKALNPYKATGRAFTGYTNAIRVSAFLEGAKYLEKKGLTYESNPKDFQKWADYVNTTTGRGSLGRAEQSAGWLSTIFFAPRKMIADLKLFTPYAFVYYARMPKTVRQKAVLDYAQAITTVVAANALLWAARRDEDDTEADQFWNPNSTNFLTHKFGNTAVEITGGMRTNIVFMSRLFSGNYTDQYGFESNLGERYGKQINTRQDLVENFLSNKFSPLISLANKKLDERKGLELDAGEYANIAIPMWLQDVRELYKSNPKEIAAMMNLLAVFGASVRTIDTHTTDSIKHKGKDVELTKQQQEEFSEIYTQKESEYLEKLVNDNLYTNATDEKKTELKQLINNAARNDAEEELKKLYPQDFQETTEEKAAREKEKQDLEDLKIRIGIIEAPAKTKDEPRTPQQQREVEQQERQQTADPIR